MFGEQAKRREHAKPLNENHQLRFARALLARLDQVGGVTPTRVVLHGPAAGALDDPVVEPPERIGGCFADLLDDGHGNEGAHEKESKSDEGTETHAAQDDEVPLG